MWYLSWNFARSSDLNGICETGNRGSAYFLFANLSPWLMFSDTLSFLPCYQSCLLFKLLHFFPHFLQGSQTSFKSQARPQIGSQPSGLCCWLSQAFVTSYVPAESHDSMLSQNCFDFALWFFESEGPFLLSLYPLIVLMGPEFIT